VGRLRQGIKKPVSHFWRPGATLDDDQSISKQPTPVKRLFAGRIVFLDFLSQALLKHTKFNQNSSFGKICSAAPAGLDGNGSKARAEGKTLQCFDYVYHPSCRRLGARALESTNSPFAGRICVRGPSRKNYQILFHSRAVGLEGNHVFRLAAH
jgi:hypothetical protein